MRSYLSGHLRHLTAASILLLSTAGVLVGTTGAQLGASSACGCEAKATFTAETENETTKETVKGGVVPISPTEKVDTVLRTTWTWLVALEVKKSKLDIIEGAEWKENQKCPNGKYEPNSANESCVTSALIQCLKAGEKLKAEQLIEIGAAVFDVVTYKGECLK
jgi:hypothetical protein